MGRLWLLFTSFTNCLQPRRNVQSSHVKGFIKAQGMLLVIGVGHREAKSYKAHLPCGAQVLFALIPLVLVASFARLVFSSIFDVILADSGGCLGLSPLPTCFSVDSIPDEQGRWRGGHGLFG